MRTKRIVVLMVLWFGLQAVFMLCWPVYLFYTTGHKFFELQIYGVVLLLSTIFILVKNKTIKRIGKILLCFYSLAFTVVGTLAILVASPKKDFAIQLTIIMVINLVLLGKDFLDYIKDYLKSET